MAAWDQIARRGDALLESIAGTSVGSGQVAFWWTGQHSVILKFQAALVFCDPYLQPHERRTKPPVLTPEQCAGFDLIVCSHDHSDHIDPWAVPGITAASQATFVAPRAHRQRMLSLGVPADRLVLLNDGESAVARGVMITAIKAEHEFFEETDDGLFPFLGYVLEANGVRVYHAGDTLWWEGLQARLRELLPLDLAFVPINGRDAVRLRANCLGNMSFAEAVDLVGPLSVGLAVPTHFDMFESNSEDPTKFVDYLATKYPGVPSWLGPAGEPVVVAASRRSS